MKLSKVMKKNMKLLILFVDKIKIRWQVKGKLSHVVHFDVHSLP